MKKAMLFVVSMLFSLGVSAATLGLTGPTVSPAGGGFVTLNNDTTVSGQAGAGGSIGSSFEFQWLLNTDQDTEATFLTEFLPANTTPSLEGYVSLFDAATNDLLFTSAVANVVSFSYWLFAETTYLVKIAGDFVTNQASSQLTVSAVPVPAALLLFGPALLGLFGLRRKAVSSTAVSA